MHEGYCQGNVYEKRPLGRPSRSWGDNINTYLKEIRLNGVYRLYPAEDKNKCRAVVGTVINLQIHRLWGISCISDL
jgi:hypothetical protein